MSLLELLIVLGLLVVVAAMAIPTLERPMQAERLRRAAQLVQAQWDRARVRAMQSGQIMVFQYQPESGRFRVQPWTTDDFALESSEMLTNADASSSAATALTYTDVLPEGIEFFTSITLSETRSITIEEELSKLTQSVSPDNSWSAPVLFYPDGTATTAEVTLANDSGSYITIRLRGLTGIARISDVLSTGTGEALQ